MSFPYTTTSPPPTSGALTVVDKANLSQSYAGGGGGASTIGPNPQVSTLSFSAFSQGTAGFMNMDGFFAVCDNGSTPTGNNYTIGIQTQTNPNTTGNNYSFLSSFVSTLSLTLLNSGYDVSPASATIITGASSDGRAIIANPVPLSTLTLLANPVNIPYDLQVSSINGAAPGGSVGPNLVVSTMSVNDSGNILMTWNNGGGTLNFGFEGTNTSSFQLQQGIGVVGTKVAGPEGCLQALEKDGGANQVFAPLQASGFEVCATAYPGGAFAGLYFSSIGSVLYSAVGQPLTIDAPAGVNVSSLSVSSINGAAPGGGNIYPLPSTLKTGEATGLSINASSLTTLAAFSTISSHFYTVSVDMGPKQLLQTFGATDAYQTQLTTDDGLVNILNQGLWSEVSTLYNSALQITPGLGGSATFKAGGDFMTLDIYNTYTTNDTLSTNLNAIFAIDHGPGP